MSYENIGRLVDRWVGDKAFRKAVRLNMESAVRDAGIQIVPEEWDILKRVDWKLSDEELQSRVSKAA